MARKPKEDNVVCVANFLKVFGVLGGMVVHEEESFLPRGGRVNMVQEVLNNPLVADVAVSPYFLSMDMAYSRFQVTRKVSESEDSAEQPCAPSLNISSDVQRSLGSVSEVWLANMTLYEPHG